MLVGQVCFHIGAADIICAFLPGSNTVCRFLFRGTSLINQLHQFPGFILGICLPSIIPTVQSKLYPQRSGKAFLPPVCIILGRLFFYKCRDLLFV